MKEMISIRVKDVSKIYRLYNDPAGRLKESLWRGRRSYHQDFWALKNTSFEVRKGSTVGVIGRNGSGKSTLLQLIANIVTPTHGHIEVSGRVSALLELGSGFDPEFTGRENVFMNGVILGLSREEVSERFNDIERFAGVGRFIDQPVKLYSSGMYVRLAFATAINVDPDILLVDESLAVGDIIFQHRCMSKIREIQEQGKTIFFVSHDIGAVNKLCTEAILLEKGEIMCMGLPEKVVQEYYKIIWNAEEKDRYEDSESGEMPDDVGKDIALEEVMHYDHRFGNRKGEIIAFALTDEKGQKCETLVGGPKIFFSIAVKCHEQIDMPLVGFVVRDLLGNELIKTNTDAENFPLTPCPRDSIVQVSFSFELPQLRPGSYAVSAGFGNGTIDRHSAYDWIENIVVFTVECEEKCYGLMRTPITVSQKFLGVHD
jgi:lipopolysaccharide transport system ATP-binding protein